MQSRTSGDVGKKSRTGSNDGKKGPEGQRGSPMNSRSPLSASSSHSALAAIPDGIPCAVVSAAFHGPRFVAEFQHRLVQEHLSLARRIANYFAGRLRGRGPSPDELKSAAYEGLCTAALRYVESRGRFGPYAGIWIKREVIRRMVAGGGVVSRPRNAVERAREITRQRAEVTQEIGAEVGDEDLASRLVVPETPRHHHRRQRLETAEEIRLLESLLYPQPSELQTENHLAAPEVDLDPDLPVSPLLEQFLDGWTIPEIAEREKWHCDRAKARIANEIRRFFRQ